MQSHRRAGTRRANGYDPAAVGFDNGLADRQAQAGVILGTGTRRGSPVEAFENTRQVLGGDADAGVGHDRDNFAILRAGVHLDPAFRPVIFEGVRDQIQEYAGKLVGMADQRGRLQVRFDPNIPLRRQEPELGDAIRGDLGQVRGGSLALFAALALAGLPA